MDTEESKSSRCRVYSYGAKPPLAGADLVFQQIHLAHDYRNSLVELELNRRKQVRTVMLSMCPDVLRIDQEIAELRRKLNELREEIGKRNQAARRRTGTKEEREQIAVLAKRLKELSTQRKALSPYGRPEVKQALVGVENATAEERKRLRSASGLYWGNYLAVEQGMLAARNNVMPPRFRRWTGEGKVAVQIQKGMSVANAFGKDGCLRIEPMSPDAWEKGQPKSKRRTKIQIRVGSDEKRKPIWATVSVTMHRPLPSTGRIRWAYLAAKRTGTTIDWSVQFVVEVDEQFVEIPQSRGEVGIDFGWRLMDEGLRVAYWVDSSGQTGQLVLPIRDVERWRKAAELRATRDAKFNEAKEQLGSWIASLKRPPEWLHEARRSLPMWRSRLRLLRLHDLWCSHRKRGDDQVFDAITAWVREDRHLFQWESHQRAKAVRWRDDLYRRFAAAMRRYSNIYIGNTNWAQIARTPAPEAEQVYAGGKGYRQIAAPGRLVRLLTEGSSRVVKVEATDVTSECHECGHRNDFEAWTGPLQKCTACNAMWDQDENAAKNVLARGAR